ncbi:MAG: hypothetical protein U9Q72_00215 [Patescibacteria group bacterium]|nr:hypothetical protein [Patescibacteria group bacterium]
MRFLITGLSLLLGVGFLFGCSHSPRIPEKSSEGTVARIFSNSGGETTLTEGGTGRVSLVSLNKIKSITEDIKTLIEEISEISTVISAYQRQELEIKNIANNYEGSTDEAIESPEIDTGDNEDEDEDEDEEDEEDEGDEQEAKQEEEQVATQNTAERDKIMEAIEARIQAIEELGKEVNDAEYLEDENKGKISDNLIGVKGKLADIGNDLSASSSGEFAKIKEEVVAMQILGGELSRVRELMLVYRGQSLISEEITPLLLSTEEKIGGMKGDGVDVSQAETVLGSIRQLLIDAKGKFDDVQARLEGLDFSQTVDIDRVISSEGVEGLAAAGENLKKAREALITLGEF